VFAFWIIAFLFCEYICGVLSNIQYFYRRFHFYTYPYIFIFLSFGQSSVFLQILLGKFVQPKNFPRRPFRFTKNPVWHSGHFFTKSLTDLFEYLLVHPFLKFVQPINPFESLYLLFLSINIPSCLLQDF